MVARTGEYGGSFGRFRMGIQVRQYPGLFVRKEGLQSYFSRLIVNSPLSIGFYRRVRQFNSAAQCFAPWPAQLSLPSSVHSLALAILF
jgi:hypothetical protein